MTNNKQRLICTNCNSFDYDPPAWRRSPDLCPICGAGAVVPAFEGGRLASGRALIGYTFTPTTASHGAFAVCPVCRRRRRLSAGTTAIYDLTRRFLLRSKVGGRWTMYVALFLEVPAGVPVCREHEPIDETADGHAPAG